MKFLATHILYIYIYIILYIHIILYIIYIYIYIYIYILINIYEKSRVWFVIRIGFSKSNFKKLKVNVFTFFQDFFPRSRIHPNKPVLTYDRVEYCITNTVFKPWNRIIVGYIYKMFKLSLFRYSTKSQIILYILIRRTNAGQKSVPL